MNAQAVQVQPLGFNPEAYSALVEAAKEAKPVLKAMHAAKEAIKGAYDHGVAAAALCKNANEFRGTVEKLEWNIRRNIDGLAVSLGAPKRDKPSKDGLKYTIPSSISTVKTVVLFAFENGVSLKTDKGEPLSFNQIRKANTAVREAVERAKADTLTGRDKIVWLCRDAMRRISDKLDALDGPVLGQLSASLDVTLKAMEKPKVSSVPTLDEQKSGEVLAAAQIEQSVKIAKANAKAKRAQKHAQPAAQAA